MAAAREVEAMAGCAAAAARDEVVAKGGDVSAAWKEEATEREGWGMAAVAGTGQETAAVVEEARAEAEEMARVA